MPWSAFATIKKGGPLHGWLSGASRPVRRRPAILTEPIPWSKRSGWPLVKVTIDPVPQSCAEQYWVCRLFQVLLRVEH